jgi:demethylmenaquinone methyltransferase/2-methoxy-6-polyprenyl-1,4-benzoquinol methylase
MTVLEPGCGAGRITALLSDAVGPAGHVIAVDISERMIAAARRNIGAANVEFRHGPTEELRLAPQSVDIILCFDVFPHFADAGHALDLFHRWLAADGGLVIAHYPGRHRVNAIHRGAGRAVGADRLPDEPQIRRLLDAHGFRVGSLTDRADCYFLRATPARP